MRISDWSSDVCSSDLVLGASGGVGTACVVLAKLLGAEVIACAGSASKLEGLKALGADHLVNYRDTDFSKWAIGQYGKPQRRNQEGGVDVVINFTGGDTLVPRSEERRVGKECGRRCRYRGSPDPKKKK